MIRYAYWIGGQSALMLMLLCATSVQASNYREGLIQGKTCVPDCVRDYCCDDYCPKHVPCLHGIKTKCCDDYCEKPTPCIRRACIVCDDYRPKCQPQVPCPARKLTCQKGCSRDRCEPFRDIQIMRTTGFLRK